MLQLGIVRGRNRHQLRDPWRLRHGVYEFIADQVNSIDFALQIALHQNLYRTDDLGDLRAVTDVTGLCNHLGADALEKAQRLAAESDHFDFDTLFVKITDEIERSLEHVGVQATAETTIGGNCHNANTLDRPFHQVGMPVFAVRARHVMNHG